MPNEREEFMRFTHPRILYAEARVVAGAPGIYLDQNQLRTSRDMLIDYIWLSEESASLDTGEKNLCLLHNLLVNWAISDRQAFYPHEGVPCGVLHNLWDAERTAIPFNMFGDPIVYPAVFLWRHTVRWLLNPAQGIRVDWSLTPAQIQVGAIETGFVMHAVGLKTGMRRLYGIRVPTPQGPPIGLPPLAQTAASPTTAHNLGDEPYLVESTGIYFGKQWAANPDADTRWLNLLKYKVVPTWADAWSEVPLPVLMYGLQMGMPARSVIHKPAGGPIYLKAGQAVNFWAANTGNVDTNIQVALIGRVAYGVGSLS